MNATLSIPNGLTKEETDFVYNVEVLGLPARKAAVMSGMPATMVTAKHIIQARETTKKVLRDSMAITKDDVVYGIKDAIDRARILSEPMVEIVGWEKIAKLLGFDAPTRIDINITESIEVVKAEAKRMSDRDLVKLLGADDVVDVEFYEVQKTG